MAIPKAIIITAVPKYIGADGSLTNNVGIKLKSGNSILRCNTSDLQSSDLVSNKIVIPKVEYSPKRRLDHLSLEEKQQRKKLKNRVAAQSSRDRKKARMDDLESEVRALREKNDLLMQQCEDLKQEKAQLATENEELRHKLENHQAHCVGCRVQVEPAEFCILPLPKGWTLQQALCLGHKTQVMIMWRLMTYSLLYQISSTVLMEICAYLTWMNWQKAYSKKLNKNLLTSMTKIIQSLELLGAKEKEAILKWWGRHQKMWKPVEN
ncbi:hypothetical protein L9F63_021533 [Diploptera punctata]|uniref:X-box-binding protein 1 n=1 Tax=Diploptera punctata TaxID=6984 RepID=A0AAD7ZNP1_DIPPU|nr:hypothetical protein L9F63_021533 [Diploptera punctata]